MKVQYGDSLYFVWRVAQLEGRRLRASTLDPVHLIIALAKMVDIDFIDLVPKDAPNRDARIEELLRETRRLRTIFQKAGLDPKIFRRRLRGNVPEPRFAPEESEILHRSVEAKQVFSEADNLAEQGGQRHVFPAHLLLAVLMAKDDTRDQVLVDLGIKKRRLLDATRREVFIIGHSHLPGSQSRNAGRN